MSCPRVMKWSARNFVHTEDIILWALSDDEEEKLFLHQNKRPSALLCAAGLPSFTCL